MRYAQKYVVFVVLAALVALVTVGTVPRVAFANEPTKTIVTTNAKTTAKNRENEWQEPGKPAPRSSRVKLPPNHPVLCSQTKPLCVHGVKKSDLPIVTKALGQLEGAYRSVVDVLSWKAPLSDRDLGPTTGFDVYLSGTDGNWHVVGDPISLVSSWVQSSAFAVIDPRLARGCGLGFALAASVARAGIYAIDAAANDQLANATASYIAMLTSPCEQMVLGGIDSFQARPNRAVSHPWHDNGRGAMVLTWYLQQLHGQGVSVDLLHYLWSAGAQRVSGDGFMLYNEPDFIDSVGVLANSIGKKASDIWLDFAVARAFMGNRANGLYLTDSAFLGPCGAIRFEWSVKYSSLPRRLGPRFGVEPTGASYVWVTIDNAKPGAGLGFRGDWETPDVFRFSLITIDAKGGVLERYDPVSPQGEGQVEYNIEDLRGATGLLVVVTNTGSILQDIAFDPDNYPYVEKGYTVSLFAQ